MKAVILAAGMGTRLRPITDNVPKCMVQVNGVTIIEKQIKNLLKNDVNEILVVGGYQIDKLKQHISSISSKVKVVNNKDYDKTNNMYSLNMAKSFIGDDDFLLLNGDVFFEENIIKELVENKHPDMIVCDNNNYLEESMKIIVNNEKIASISKKIDPIDCYGVTIDIYKFSSDTVKKLFDTTHQIIFVENNLNSWSEVAIDKILPKIDCKPLDIDYNWVEIDNHDDLALAKKLFA